MPRLGRITGISSSAYSSCGRIRSAHTPVAFTTLVPHSSNSPPSMVSRTSTPAARPPRSTRPVTSHRFAITAPKRSASPSTVSTSRTSSVWQS